MPCVHVHRGVYEAAVNVVIIVRIVIVADAIIAERAVIGAVVVKDNYSTVIDAAIIVERSSNIDATIAGTPTAVIIVDAIIIDNFIVVLDAIVVEADVVDEHDDVVVHERGHANPRNDATVVRSAVIAVTIVDVSVATDVIAIHVVADVAIVERDVVKSFVVVIVCKWSRQHPPPPCSGG